MTVFVCFFALLVIAVWLAATRHRLAAQRYLVIAGVAMALPNLFLFVHYGELKAVESSTAPMIVLFELIWGGAVYAVCHRSIRKQAGIVPKGIGSRYTEPTVGLALLLFGAAGVQSLWEGNVSVLSVAFIAAGVAAIVWAVAKTSWRVAIKYFASAEAAAIILGAIMLGTVAGTLALQGVGGVEFNDRYGPLASPLRALHIDDIFRSWPFILALFLLGASSVVTAYRRRKSLLQWQHFGLMMSHVAVVAILIGAFMGLWGQKGMVHLEVGKASPTFLSSTRDGTPGTVKPLGFALRLDNFHLDNYEAEYKFYTYEWTKDGSESKLIASHAAEPGQQLAVADEAAGGSDVTVTVERVFRSYGATTSWEADPSGAAGPPQPVANVALMRAGDDPTELWLTSAGGKDATFAGPDGRFALRLAWDAPSEADLAGAGGEDGGAQHRVTLPDGQGLNVKVGKSYPLPDGRTLVARKFLPDFKYDIATKSAGTRSNRPDNPVLEIALLEAGDTTDPAAAPARLLFAREDLRRMMESNGHDKSGGLSYAYGASKGSARTTADRLVIIAASSSERLEIIQGRIVSRSPITWGTPFDVPSVAKGVGLSVAEPMRNASPYRTMGEVAGGEPNPAAEVKFLTPDGKTGRTTLLGKQAQPMRISDKRVIAYREKPGKIRNFESTLSVLEGGNVVATKTIKVNDPLSYGGFMMYQSNFDQKRPTYSGIQVVSDPGLFLVEAGLWILMFGVLQTVLMRSWKPVWRRKLKKAAPKRRDDSLEATA